jgi:hypothetical protein
MDIMRPIFEHALPFLLALAAIEVGLLWRQGRRPYDGGSEQGAADVATRRVGEALVALVESPTAARAADLPQVAVQLDDSS